ncbi:MAG: VOC family protein [Acidaminococcaceae bacterium]|nr:VOC family protein [Acidaminococcaceae bacterium]MBQ9698317.1 VOC family protein [Acidaminococcaceae bacterium]MBR1591213.1 VOC family protein [Acidaminococcaceae bacterium]
MKIKDIDHFVLTTADLEACLRFYTETLGMEKREANGGFPSGLAGIKSIYTHARPSFCLLRRNLFRAALICVLKQKMI